MIIDGEFSNKMANGTVSIYYPTLANGKYKAYYGTIINNTIQYSGKYIDSKGDSISQY